MSFQGQIACRTCKLFFPMGKLLWEGDTLESGTGFWHAGLSDEELGRAVLHFLAQHVTHDVVVGGCDDLYEQIGDIGPFDTLEQMDDDCPWAKTHEPIFLGGVKFYRRPCEPVAARERRLKGE